jgi:hypothetical protein
MLASFLYDLLHLSKLFTVASDQNDRAMLGQLECRGATNAGRRAGDDVGFAPRWSLGIAPGKVVREIDLLARPSALWAFVDGQ